MIIHSPVTDFMIVLALATAIMASVATGLILVLRVRSRVQARMAMVTTIVSFFVSVFFAGGYSLMLVGSDAGAIIHPSVSVVLVLIMAYSVIVYRYELRLTFEGSLTRRVDAAELREDIIATKLQEIERRLQVLESESGRGNGRAERQLRRGLDHIGDTGRFGAADGIGQGEEGSEHAEGRTGTSGT